MVSDPKYQDNIRKRIAGQHQLTEGQEKRLALIQAKELAFEQNTEQLRNDLIENGCYIFIEKYVEKYGKNIHDKLIQEYISQQQVRVGSSGKKDASSSDKSSQFWRMFDNSNISNLSFLLSQKTPCRIDTSYLNRILEEEVEKYSYKVFKKRMTSNQPKDINELLYNLLNIYGVCYSIYLEVLFKLADDLKIGYNKNGIGRKISTIQKKIEISNFEKFLLSDISTGVEDLDHMSGYDFERFLKSLFAYKGYTVEHTSLSNDQGADLVVLKFGIKTVIQAKRSGSKIGNKAVQECVAAINHYQANNGMVITNSEFTTPAINLAKSNGITLVDRAELSKMLAS